MVFGGWDGISLCFVGEVGVEGLDGVTAPTGWYRFDRIHLSNRASEWVRANGKSPAIYGVWTINVVLIIGDDEPSVGWALGHPTDDG
jgi:hypothetical protein